MSKFPDDFLWGAATSSYQVEGGNDNADWWHWEKPAGKEQSGAACRHFELYEQDFDLIKSLNHNAHRLSIEWSRIEPEEGHFSPDALRHYVDVITALRKRNIEPIVTLHHFTNPQWLALKGGWEKRRTVERFQRYCYYVVRALAPQVRYWNTINEPNVYMSHAYVMGVWPPQKRSFSKAKAVEDNLARAHIRAYRLMQDIYQGLNLPKPFIGIAQNVIDFLPSRPILRDRVAAFIRDRWYNFGFLDCINRHKAMDFIGINYYSRQLAEAKSWSLKDLAFGVRKYDNHPLKKNSLGWDIYPEGLYDVLVEMKKFNLPVMVTENGICTDDDNLRWEYISSHLKNVHRAIEAGVKVKGYLYWSLMDNFEWAEGFAPRFGLIGIDYATQQRMVRESARKYGEVCKTGEI